MHILAQRSLQPVVYRAPDGKQHLVGADVLIYDAKIGPERPVSVDREDRPSETRKTQDCRPVGNYGPAPAGHYAVLCSRKSPSTPGRRDRSCPIWRSSLSATAAAVQPHSRHLPGSSRCRFSLPTFARRARQRLGSADGGHWRDLRKTWVSTRSHPFDDCGARGY